MFEIIKNYNYNIKILNELLRLKYAYEWNSDKVIAEYKEKLLKWNTKYSNSFSKGIIPTLNQEELEELNFIFWALNIILFNESKKDKKTFHDFFEIIIKILLILDNEDSLETKKMYLYMLLNFKKRFFFIIENETLLFRVSTKDVNLNLLDIEDNKELVKYFINFNQISNFYPITIERNYDYKICPNNLYSIIEILYYLSSLKNEFMAEEIKLNLNNFFNKRFYFIMLNNHFSEKNVQDYFLIFRKTKDYFLDEEFLFIMLSRMNNEEFNQFLINELEWYENSDFLLKAKIFWKYYDIYKFYNNNFELETNNLALLELLNYRNQTSKKPKTFDELEQNIWFNFDEKINLNSIVQYGNISDIQQKKSLIINNYNKYEKIIYLVDEISILTNKNQQGFFYNEIDAIISNLNENLNEIIKSLNDSEEIKEILKTVDNFNYTDFFKRKFKDNLSLLKSYLIDFNNVTKINFALSNFCKKYYEKSTLNNIKINEDSCVNFLNELNECFNLELDSKDSKYHNVFLLCKIDENFFETLSSFCYGNKYMKKEKLFLSNLDRILSTLLTLKETGEFKLLKEKINLELKIKKFSILTNNVFPNNIFVMKYNIFFQSRKNYMKKYFEQNILDKKDREFYLLIFLKSIFFEGYRAKLEGVRHLEFIMEPTYIINIFENNFQNWTNEKFKKRETEECLIHYSDDPSPNKVVLWSLFLIYCFSNKFYLSNKFDSFKKIFTKYFGNKIEPSSFNIYLLIGTIYINVNYLISLNEINQQIMHNIGQIIIWFLKGTIFEERPEYLGTYKISEEEFEEYSRYLNQEIGLHLYNFNRFSKDKVKINLLIFNALILFENLDDFNKYNEEEIKIVKKAFDFSNKKLDKKDMWIFKNINVFKKHFPLIQKNIDFLEKT